jgi:hypothetical protein
VFEYDDADDGYTEADIVTAARLAALEERERGTLALLRFAAEVNAPASVVLKAMTGTAAGPTDPPDDDDTVDWQDDGVVDVRKAAAMPDEIDGDHTPAELLAAAVEVVQRARDNGTDPQDALDALHALGMGGTFGKAWDSNKHPRGDDGKFIRVNDIKAAKKDPAKAKALRDRVTNPEERKKLDHALHSDELSGSTRDVERHASQVRREQVQANRTLARKLRIKLADQESRGEALDPDDLRALIPHLSTMTQDELSTTRVMLERSGASFGGKRLRADRVAALTQWALDTAAGKTDEPAPEKPEAESGSAAAQGKPPKTRLQAQAERARAANPPPDPNAEFGTAREQYQAFLRYAHPDDPAQKPDPGAVAEYLSKLPDGAREKLDQHFATAGKSLAQVEAFHRARMAEATPEPTPRATSEQPAAVPDGRPPVVSGSGAAAAHLVGDTLTYTGRAGSMPAEFRGYHTDPGTGEKMARVIVRPISGPPFEASVKPSELSKGATGEQEKQRQEAQVGGNVPGAGRTDGGTGSTVATAQPAQEVPVPQAAQGVGKPAGRFVSVRKDGGTWEIHSVHDDLGALKDRLGLKHFDTQTGTWVKPGARGPVKDKNARIQYKEVPQSLDHVLDESYKERLADSFARSGDIVTDTDRQRHRSAVRNALLLGKPVPPEVLADYPDLAPQQTGTSAAPNPPDVSALKKNPKADAEHLNALAARTSDPAVKDAIESAAWNLDGVTGDETARRRATLEQLAASHRTLHDGGNAAGAEAVADVVRQYGGKLHGPAVGQPAAGDGRYYEMPAGTFTGDNLTVKRQPVVHTDARGREFVAGKGELASGSAAATGVDTGTAGGAQGGELVPHDQAVQDFRSALVTEAEKRAHQYFTIDGGGRFNDAGRARTSRQREKRPYKTPASFEPYAQFSGLKERFSDAVRAGTMTPEKLEEFKAKFERFRRGDFSEPATPEQIARNQQAQERIRAREAEAAQARQERKQGTERNAQRIAQQGFDIRKIHSDLFGGDGTHTLADGRRVDWEVVDDNGQMIGENTPADANWNYRYRITHPDGTVTTSGKYASRSRLQDSGELRKMLTAAPRQQGGSAMNANAGGGEPPKVPPVASGAGDAPKGRPALPAPSEVGHTSGRLKRYTEVKIGKGDTAARESLKARGFKYNGKTQTWYRVGYHEDVPGEVTHHLVTEGGKVGVSAEAQKLRAEANEEVERYHRNHLQPLAQSGSHQVTATDKSGLRYFGTPLENSQYAVTARKPGSQRPELARQSAAPADEPPHPAPEGKEWVRGAVQDFSGPDGPDGVREFRSQWVLRNKRYTPEEKAESHRRWEESRAAAAEENRTKLDNFVRSVGTPLPARPPHVDGNFGFLARAFGKHYLSVWTGDHYHGDKPKSDDGEHTYVALNEEDNPYHQPVYFRVPIAKLAELKKGE